MDPNLLQQIAKSLGVLLALHRDLQMKIAAWIGHKTARDERAADIGKPAARTGNDMSGHAGDKSSPTVEDAQQHQSLIQVWLIRQGDEVVSNLMQDRFTNGEFRFELKDAMRQCNHRARDGARLGRDRQTIPPGAGQRKCTAHTRQGGKRRQIAVFTFGFAARELVAHLSGKRHAGLCLRVGA